MQKCETAEEAAAAAAAGEGEGRAQILIKIYPTIPWILFLEKYF